MKKAKKEVKTDSPSHINTQGTEFINLKSESQSALTHEDINN